MKFFSISIKNFLKAPLKVKKKPQYQLDIEEFANTLGINIQWRVPSHFELQLSLPENKYINDIFFNLGLGQEVLHDEIYKHNENILQAIQTEISYGKKQIKIDRSSVVKVLESASQKRKNIIISGEGGVVKLLLLRSFTILVLGNFPFVFLKQLSLM